MKKLFEKYETLFTVLLIVLYIAVNSVCRSAFSEFHPMSSAVNTAFSVFLIVLIFILKRREFYGLKKPLNTKKLLYFLPLLFIAFANLTGGINTENTAGEIIFFIINMLNIGFIEEIIFRGFLFKMMERDNEKAAVIVSSVTFGVGHIMNLFIGADILPTLLQIIYACAAGWLFVEIFRKSGSLIPCIITHSLTNALSVFCTENVFSEYIIPLLLTIVPLAYTLYINRVLSRKSGQ
ncbi:MAG: CPBP family intramembrane metalloprotease [Clostridia bacterium]|nr:CPBP family intramembrane metalloprotease [Clostridia bacterium]